jgi:hypothetical protein
VIFIYEIIIMYLRNRGQGDRNREWMSKDARILVALALLHLVGLAVLILACFLSPYCPRTTRNGIGPPIRRISPGVRVTPDAPTPWSHLLIRVEPYLNSGDVDRVPLQAREAIWSFCLLLVADVDTDDQTSKSAYRLADVAMGIGLKDGKDVVTVGSGSSPIPAFSRLGSYGRSLFESFELTVARTRVRGRTPTMAIIDVPLLLRRGTRNFGTLRYAVLVAPTTGEVDAFAWFVTSENIVDPEIQWLPTGMVFRPPIHVDARYFILGRYPDPSAFAAESIPRGKKQIVLPDHMATLAGCLKLSDEPALEFESQLREIILK